MADAGEIKARVVIEYDGSGIDAAKEDLAKLAELAGGIGGGEGGIGDAIAAMGDQFAEGTKGASEFADSIGAIEEPLRSGEAAVSELNDALDEHQQAIGETGAAYEALQEPLGTTVSMLEESAPPMLQIAENAQKMSAPLADAGDNFAQLQDSLSQTVPMLPQFASSLHDVSEAFDPRQFGLDTFAENMSVFQDALQNPTPFSMIGQYLQETGQTWDDFNSSIGADNVSVLHDMAQNANVAGESLNSLNTNAQETGQAFSGSKEETQAFTEQYNALGGAAQDAGKSIEDVGSTVEDLGSTTEKAGGIFSSIFGEGGFLGSVGEGVGGFFGSIGNGLGGIMQGFDSLARPLFAAQMIGQMASSFGSYIYSANLAAEGPNASNPASFTSQVNQLGAGISQGGNQFAVGFGAGLNPSINAWNNENNQNGGGSDFWGGIGRFLGGATGGAGDVLEVLGGSLLAGLSFGNAGMMQTGTNWENSGMQGLVNMYDAANGLPLQYPGTPSYAGATPFERMALSNWGAQPGGMTADQQNVAADWQYFNGMPQGGAPSGPIVSRYTSSGANAYTEPQGFSGAMQDVGNFFSGLGQDFMKIWNPTNDSFTPTSYSGGCFAAGTPILLADGSEKPIEQLQVGDQVLARDGMKTIATTVLKLITPPARVVYALKFSNGATLTLTNSHPISTPEGWKALSVEHARMENPDLPVSPLQISDFVYTVDGARSLVSIEEKPEQPIYNITVGKPHTFFANGIVVHNKVGVESANLGQQAADQFQGITLPHMDLGGMASSLASSFSGIQLPHLDLGSMGSSLAGAFGGIQLPHLDLGSIGSSLGSAFSGIQLPHLDLGSMASSLGGAFSGIQLPHLDLGNIGASLAGAFSGITLPPIPNFGSMIQGALGGMFSGISLPPIPDVGAMIQGALGGMFSGISLPPIPDIGGMIQGALGGIFSGIQLPSIPDIGGMINGAIGGIFSSVHMPQIPDFGSMINGAISGIFSSIHMPAIPGFASGIEGFSGGLAMVGESGPELVSLPSGSSVYPLTMGSGVGSSSPISLGGGGSSGGVQTANIIVQLDSQQLISLMGVSLMQTINVSTGKRSW